MVPTAALVVEIVSVDDEAYAKLGFYTRHAITDIVVVDSAAGRVEFAALDSGAAGYMASARSRLLGCTVGELDGSLGRSWSPPLARNTR